MWAYVGLGGVAQTSHEEDVSASHPAVGGKSNRRPIPHTSAATKSQFNPPVPLPCPPAKVQPTSTRFNISYLTVPAARNPLLLIASVPSGSRFIPRHCCDETSVGMQSSRVHCTRVISSQ